MTERSHNPVGAVVIGRNEGERLRTCLKSIARDLTHLVYVDSGSTDGSADLARTMGVEVVNLDPSQPFTAARSRNAGYQRLRSLQGDIEFVQFVDGDCELADGYVEVAVDALRRHEDAAAVAGRLRERHPETSRYNRLCAMEWAGPTGEVDTVGGVSMMRCRALDEAGGFNPGLIAGEEPELCVRLRQLGWKIRRLDADMAWHDAAMTRFSQWWRRAVRGGHAAAEGMAMHGAPPERHKVSEVRSALFWGVGWPLLAVSSAALAIWWPPGVAVLLALLAALLIQWWRIRSGRIRVGDPASHASLYATFCLFGKPAAAVGICQYVLNRLRGRRSVLIEYKDIGDGRNCSQA